MGIFYVNLQINELLQFGQKLPGAIQSAGDQAVKDLSAMAYGHIKEQVQKKLRSTREIYDKALSLTNEDGSETWVINLDMKQAGWLESGKPAGSMINDLLSSKKIGSNGQPWVKTAKDGSKYAAVPFLHNKGETRQTPEATDLTDAIKAEFKKRRIPFGKIETEADGTPKIGKLHSLNVPTPNKTKQGSGQGWGPIGAPRQGYTETPFLRGVQVYQHEQIDKKTNTSKIVKSIVTFRIVSSKQGEGAWFHPGIQAYNFMDETADWAIDQLENVIKPKLIQMIIDSI